MLMNEHLGVEKPLGNIQKLLQRSLHILGAFLMHNQHCQNMKVKESQQNEH